MRRCYTDLLVVAGVIGWVQCLDSHLSAEFEADKVWTLLEKLYGIKKRAEPFEVSKQPLQAPKERKSLLFKHFPKCGGSYTKNIMKAAVKNFTLRSEEQRVTKADWETHYVIATIREPCDWFVSLWAFGSAGNGAMYRTIKSKSKGTIFQDVYGHLQPFDTIDEALRLERFVLGPARPVLLDRFETGYGEFPFVDCWANEGSLIDDIKACLRQYELHGGHPVDWAGVSRFLESTQEAQSRKAGRRRLGPLGNPNKSRHAKCPFYFSQLPDAMAYVTNSSRSIYDYFGFPGCCQGCCTICGIDRTDGTPPIRNCSGADMAGE